MGIIARNGFGSVLALVLIAVIVIYLVAKNIPSGKNTKNNNSNSSNNNNNPPAQGGN